MLTHSLSPSSWSSQSSVLLTMSRPPTPYLAPCLPGCPTPFHPAPGLPGTFLTLPRPPSLYLTLCRAALYSLLPSSWSSQSSVFLTLSHPPTPYLKPCRAAPLPFPQTLVLQLQCIPHPLPSSQSLFLIQPGPACHLFTGGWRWPVTGDGISPSVGLT